MDMEHQVLRQLRDERVTAITDDLDAHPGVDRAEEALRVAAQLIEYAAFEKARCGALEDVSELIRMAAVLERRENKDMRLS